MQLLIDFISGISFGIKFFSGDDCYPEDQFAIVFELGIIVITFIKLK